MFIVFSNINLLPMTFVSTPPNFLLCVSTSFWCVCQFTPDQARINWNTLFLAWSGVNWHATKLPRYRLLSCQFVLALNTSLIPHGFGCSVGAQLWNTLGFTKVGSFLLSHEWLAYPICWEMWFAIKLQDYSEWRHSYFLARIYWSPTVTLLTGVTSNC